MNQCSACPTENFVITGEMPILSHIPRRVLVDEQVCDLLGSIIRSLMIPQDEEQVSLSNWSKELVGNLYLAVVAICHQTSPRGRLPLEGSVKGQAFRGWDYLLHKFAQAAEERPDLISPAFWSNISADTLQRIFHDEVAGDRLSDPVGRASLLRDLGSKMMLRGWRHADDIYAASDHVISGPSGLLGLLSQFRAYDDPVKKKSLFFLALMRNSQVWTYRDNTSLGPPVDYHEIRGHLRLGTVRIVDEVLLRKVKAGTAVSADDDIDIRAATFSAIMRISERSGLQDPSRLHYFFWNVFRSICLRERPQCFSVYDASLLPERYRLSVSSGGTLKCPFSSVCESAGSTHPVWEHVFESDYY